MHESIAIGNNTLVVFSITKVWEIILRITLAIASLAGGGAERVAVNMANYWAAGKRWQITIVTDSQGGVPPAYDLLPEVEHRDIRFTKDGGRPLIDRRLLIESLISLSDILRSATGPEREVLMANLSLLPLLRGAIKHARPDAVISFMDLTNIRVLLACAGLGVPVIVSEHCDPNFNNVGAGIERLRRRLYPRARYLVTLTDEAMSFFSGIQGIRGKIIPNPVLSPALGAQQEQQSGKQGRMLISMGRLSNEKGFDLIVRAFARLSESHPQWSLEIWGEGPLRRHLEQLATDLGVAHRVRFPGFTKTPHLVISRADLFVLASACEGWSNVLCEAMATGLPVVSFDCPSGPRHIIRQGIDGVLVQPHNLAALVEALDRLMNDENERRRLGARAPDVVTRFGIQRVMGMWEDILTVQSDAAQPAQVFESQRSHSA